LISNHILKQVSTSEKSDFIDFSNFRFPEMIKSFFDIFKGVVLQIDENNLVKFLESIDFLETDILLVQGLIKKFSFDFRLNNIDPFFSLPVNSIQIILSSPYLKLKNERQLFELILNKIQNQREFMLLLTYSSLGNIDFSLLIGLIQTIQFIEVIESIFNHLRDSFFFNDLSFDENHEDDIQFLLSTSKDIENFSPFEEINNELNLLFQSLPILSADILDLKLKNGLSLSFTPEEKIIVEKYKSILILDQLFEDVIEKNIIIQHHSLLIFIPNSIKSIERGCFWGCSFLTQINLPNSITSIGKECFYGKSSLTQINLPNSIASIGKECFYGCSSLTQINLPNSIKLIEDRCFYECLSLTQINLSNSITSIGKECFYKCSSLTQIILPNSITSIERECFYECSSLTQINLPNSVTLIGYYCFYECSSLGEINLPNSITSIMYQCFWGCSSLTQINLPNSIKSIERGYFWGCSSLTQINFPSSIKSIGFRCFYECLNLPKNDIIN
jgi:hypothetical protein